ncbi:putative 3,2-trans-enoyl-CoA isomerase, precursor [Trypanosoma vivax]|nr:putative 3,2-trans-enoyl-CoA isomerase, precursor [Trypanosoma vivax]
MVILRLGKCHVTCSMRQWCRRPSQTPFGRTHSDLSAGTGSGRLVDVSDSPIPDVKVLSMSNPPANVLSLAMLEDIMASIAKLCDPQKSLCRGLVLTSAVPNIFSVGFDLHSLYAAQDYETFAVYWRQVQKLYVTLNTLPVPLVAAINGSATGFGCILALSADYRVMAEGSSSCTAPYKIGLDFVQSGLTVPPCFAAVVVHTVGHRNCEALFQLGELHVAHAAREMGLIDETVESADEVLVHALDMGEKLSDAPPWSFWVVKDALRKELVSPLCTEALRAADCSNFYEFLKNQEVHRDLGKFLARGGHLQSSK